MVKYVNKTEQLNVFDTFVTSMLSNKTLSAKFKKADFYDFRPLTKSARFAGFPYIVFNYPSTKTEFEDLKRKLTSKDFESEVLLIVEFDARGKFREYANAMIAQVEADQADFRTAGYDDVILELLDSDVELENQKKVIVGRFVWSANGMVER